MRKIVFTLAVGTAFAAPAAAQTYVGVSGGLALPTDSRNEGAFDAAVPATVDFPAIPAGTALAWDTQFDNGFEISGQFGYAFGGGLRAELQLAYNQYGVASHSNLAVGGTVVDGADSAVLTRGPANAANPRVGAVLATDEGEVSNIGLFGNIFYDIATGSDFTPYFGAGAGYQWTTVDYRPSGVVVGDDTDGAFAYQLMGGASFALSDTADIFAQYTYRDTFEDPEIPLTLLPATLAVESQQSIVTAGVRFRF